MAAAAATVQRKGNPLNTHTHTHTQPMALQLAFSDRYSVAAAAAIVHCQIKHYIT